MAINPKNKLFPAQEESEKVLSVLRKHWFRYAIFWFVGFMMLVPFVAVVVSWLNNVQDISPIWGNLLIVFGSMYLLFLMALLMYGFVDFYLDVYIITDKRIVNITQNGFFKREIAEVDLHQIQDVNAEVNGIAATFLHFGNVYIQTAGELPNFIFESVPHPYETSKKIIDLHQAYLKNMQDDSKTGRNKIVSAWKTGFDDSEQNGESDTDCYTEDTCNQKLLQGIEQTKKEQQSKTEGVLNEGESVDLD